MRMTAYAEQRRARKRRGRQPAHPPLSVAQAAWLPRSQELQVDGRRFRQAAKASDAQWRQLRQAHRQQKAAWRALSLSDKRRRSAEHAAEKGRWQQARDARRVEMAERRAADLTWRQARQALRAEEAQWKPLAQPVVTWVAILVIIDNCTRQCLGLPCFTDGMHVTAEVVIEALGKLLPAGLQFLISDNGSPFRSDALATLAPRAHFVHMRIAPYRARTNGIAERFVRTLKEGLQGESWSIPKEVPGLLAQQLNIYNERPHQGREL